MVVVTTSWGWLGMEGCRRRGQLSFFRPLFVLLVGSIHAPAVSESRSDDDGMTRWVAAAAYSIAVFIRTRNDERALALPSFYRAGWFYLAGCLGMTATRKMMSIDL